MMSQLGVSLITTKLSDPTGFGRIIRGAQDNIIAIVEQKEASKQELAINEINTGIMAADAALFKKYLAKIAPTNAQGEYYLTDVIKLAVQDGLKIAGLIAKNNDEVFGVNDKEQLAYLERAYQRAQASKLMQQGVTLFDPARFDVRGNLVVGADVVVDVNVICEGEVIIGNNCKIGANNILRDVKIGDNVEIKPNCVLEGAMIENGCIIGPFARIRPTSHLKSEVHIGNFVEVKNTEIDAGSKANHLAYIGDAVIGKKVNVGAGAITCNYDGANKYQTIIEDGAFIGSDVQLIAPVTVGKNATIGAGSTITQNAPADKLTVSRARQTVIENWQRPKKGEHKGK
jgi:bifunctional UDP-N-acetylglucosamine pyrophosphorylase/glucosamine-1-phosphate N-acetyltransferase